MNSKLNYKHHKIYLENRYKALRKSINNDPAKVHPRCCTSTEGISMNSALKDIFFAKSERSNNIFRTFSRTLLSKTWVKFCMTGCSNELNGKRV